MKLYLFSVKWKRKQLMQLCAERILLVKSMLYYYVQEIKKETKPVRLINLLYLANDVIQNSRKHCPHFMGMFYENLEPAFRYVHLSFEPSIAFKLL